MTHPPPHNSNNYMISRHPSSYTCISLSKFQSAMTYFDSGIVLLNSNNNNDDDDGWNDHYDLMLELRNSAAEVSTSLGTYEITYEHVQNILTHAHSFQDTWRALTTKLHALGTSGEAQRATEEGLLVLKKLGVDIPWKLSKLQVIWEWWWISRRLNAKSNESLMRLPPMNDPQKLAAIQILNLIFLSVVLTNSEMVAVIALKMITLTLDYGLSAASCVSFMIYAFAVGSIDGKIDQANRFAKLSFALYKRFGARVYLARISVFYFDGVHCLTRPAQEMIPALDNGFLIGLETGDVEFALLCASIRYSTVELDRLPRLEHNLQILSDRLSFHRQTTLGCFIRPEHQCVHNLLEYTNDPTVLQGNMFNPKADMLFDSFDQGILLWTKTHELLLGCLFGKYEVATELTPTHHRVLVRTLGTLGSSIFMFYHGFADVALARKQNNENGRAPFKIPIRRATIARKYSRVLQKWSLNNPLPYLGRHLLLEAELSALQYHKSTLVKYTNAISVLKDGGLLPLVALANERLGYYLNERRDMGQCGKTYLQRAMALYKDWGPTTKVSHFRIELQRLGVPVLLSESVENSVVPDSG